MKPLLIILCTINIINIIIVIFLPLNLHQHRSRNNNLWSKTWGILLCNTIKKNINSNFRTNRIFILSLREKDHRVLWDFFPSLEKEKNRQVVHLPLHHIRPKETFIDNRVDSLVIRVVSSIWTTTKTFFRLIIILVIIDPKRVDTILPLHLLHCRSRVTRSTRRKLLRKSSLQIDNNSITTTATKTTCKSILDSRCLLEKERTRIRTRMNSTVSIAHIILQTYLTQHKLSASFSLNLLLSFLSHCKIILENLSSPLLFPILLFPGIKKSCRIRKEVVLKSSRLGRQYTMRNDEWVWGIFFLGSLWSNMRKEDEFLRLLMTDWERILRSNRSSSFANKSLSKNRTTWTR